MIVVFNHHHHPTLLFLCCFAWIAINSTAFPIPSQQSNQALQYDCNSSTSRRQVSSNDNDMEFEKEDSKQVVEGKRSTRRTMITNALWVSLVSTTTQAAAVAAANDENNNPNKIMLQTSSKNIPPKLNKTKSRKSTTTTTKTTTTNTNTCTTLSESALINVFEMASPSVVNIDTFVEATDGFSTNIFEVPIGSGSGFVWDEQGHIVTNFHVVRNVKTANVAILTQVKESKPTKFNTSSGVVDFKRKVYLAKVVGIDPDKDIAVLKVDAPVEDLYPISVGKSQGLKVGQSAYAIGNPFGLDHTLTTGIVSGLGREVKSPIGRPITNVIQTDAAINPGNSGGPLLDSQGKLIGINTSIFSPSGASAGIGFAIPVDTAAYIIDTLIKDGKVVRSILGITIIESRQARAFGITKGILVLDVPPSSPAFKAGLRGTKKTESGLINVGDIIVKIDQIDIYTEADLFAALETFKPGDVVKLTVNRPDLDLEDSSTDTNSNGSMKLKLTSKDLEIQLISSESMQMFNNKKLLLNGGPKE